MFFSLKKIFTSVDQALNILRKAENNEEKMQHCFN